jgi:hypothetical protein
MKTVQHFLVCALLAALTALAVYATLLVRTAASAVAAIPGEIGTTRSALTGEIAAAREDLTRQIAAARRDVVSRSDRQLTGIRRDLLAEADAVRDTADRRMGDTLARADAALHEIEGLRQDLKPSLDHTAAITAQIDGALPLFLDCDHNPDCVFNRYVGVARSVERATLNLGQVSQDVRSALPPMLRTWNHIGADVSATAGNINRLTKPHWYDRLLGYGLNGVLIYRNLNPATNLTTRAAQIISSRP